MVAAPEPVLVAAEAPAEGVTAAPETHAGKYTVKPGETLMMIKRTFDPGFRIGLHQKDLNLALSSARALGVPLPNTAMAQELFNACVAHGGQGWDHSAMVRALEKMANFEMGQAAAA